MKKYIQPQTTSMSVMAGQIICSSVITVSSKSGTFTGPIEKLGQVYIDIKNAL